MGFLRATDRVRDPGMLFETVRNPPEHIIYWKERECVCVTTVHVCVSVGGMALLLQVE